MKSKVTIISLCFLSISCAIFSGCSSDSVSSSNPTISSTTAEKSSTTTDTLSEPNTASESLYETAETASQKGEPTIFIAPDGIQIYSSEITAIDGTSKTAAELIETDYGTSVLCEGFQYFTEPSGISYNNYQNPEMFDDMLYKGEPLENENKCERLDVGEKLCGLTLVNAVSEFKIDNYADTPEPYFYDGYLFGNDSERYVAEFEGTIKVNGFLGVTAPNDYEPKGGSLHFNPTESKLPILGNNPEFYEKTNYVGNEYSVYSDMSEIYCGFIQELECYTSGIEEGDMVFVCLTLSNIKYKSSNSIIAEIENIELLSDILYHDNGNF